MLGHAEAVHAAAPAHGAAVHGVQGVCWCCLIRSVAALTYAEAQSRIDDERLQDPAQRQPAQAQPGATACSRAAKPDLC